MIDYSVSRLRGLLGNIYAEPDELVGSISWAIERIEELEEEVEVLEFTNAALEEEPYD